MCPPSASSRWARTRGSPGGSASTSGCSRSLSRANSPTASSRSPSASSRSGRSRASSRGQPQGVPGQLDRLAGRAASRRARRCARQPGRELRIRALGGQRQVQDALLLVFGRARQIEMQRAPLTLRGEPSGRRSQQRMRRAHPRAGSDQQTGVQGGPERILGADGLQLEPRRAGAECDREQHPALPGGQAGHARAQAARRAMRARRARHRSRTARGGRARGPARGRRAGCLLRQREAAAARAAAGSARAARRAYGGSPHG